jgi:transcriptional regulator with XRE-family HTH domain
MRKARGWSQKELAAAARMTQARISLLENPNYEGAVNVKTLEKLASAFDVGLAVRFVPFSELVDWAIGVSRRGHDVVEHSKDEGLKMSVVQVAGTEVVFTASTSQADNYCSLVGPAWTVIGSSPPTSIPLYVQQPSSQIQVNTCFAKAA